MRHAIFGDADDTAEERLKKTQFLCEASYNEWFTMWSRWCADSLECREIIVRDWKQLGGYHVTVGYLAEMPVHISLNWDLLDGYLVCNWEPTSQVVDHRLIDKWIKKNFTTQTHDGRNATCNASNFHHLTQELRYWKEKNDVKV